MILPGSWHYSRARSTGLSQRTLAGRKQSLSRQNDLSEYAAALASSANRVVIHYGNSFCDRLFFFCIFYLLSTLWAGPVLYTLELFILGPDFLSLVYVCTRHAMTYSQVVSLSLLLSLFFTLGIFLTVYVLIWQYKQYILVSSLHTNHDLGVRRKRRILHICKASRPPRIVIHRQINILEWTIFTK